MPINPDHFRPLRRHRIYPLHWVLQAIETAYWLCRGKLTLHQAWRIWSSKARLVMRDPYDECEGWIGPH